MQRGITARSRFGLGFDQILTGAGLSSQTPDIGDENGCCDIENYHGVGWDDMSLASDIWGMLLLSIQHLSAAFIVGKVGEFRNIFK